MNRRRIIIMFGWLFALFGCEKQDDPTAKLPALNRENDLHLFYPVLRDYHPGDVFAQTIVHRPIAEGLAVFACRRIDRPGGRVGVDYVMKRNLGVYNMSEEQIINACYDNFFAANIQVTGAEQGDSKLFQFTSDEGLVAAILGHESTYPKFADITKSAEMAVLIQSQDAIYVTPAGSSFERDFADLAREETNAEDPIDLTSAVYYWTTEGKLVPQAEWKRRVAEQP
jgi:hypothetical protein